MRILVVRRDNIGDLVCTTPLLALLRERHPDAEIAVLANSYNAPVLDGNPDISQVQVYTKLKHRDPGASALGTLARSLRTYLDLRRARFDWAILAGGNCTPAMIAAGRRSGARRLIGYRPGDARLAGALDVCLEPVAELRHEVIDTAALGTPLGVEGEPGPLKAMSRVATGSSPAAPVIAIALGARDDKRWPAARFAALCDGLRERHAGLRLLLLWPPASAVAATRSDDEAIAKQLLAGNPSRTSGRATSTLRELIDALAAANLVVSVDGGAVHLAAALGKPVVALYANRPEVYRRWYPWKVPSRVVVSPEALVCDISAEAVMDAVASLAAEVGIGLG